MSATTPRRILYIGIFVALTASGVGIGVHLSGTEFSGTAHKKPRRKIATVGSFSVEPKRTVIIGRTGSIRDKREE